MDATKLGLYKKIHEVMKSVDYLQKDNAIEFKTTKYKAISEEKVTSTVRKALVEQGLIILPVEQEHTKVDSLSTVNTKYKIVDIETGQYEIIVSSGTGSDTQDKGVGKAMTYSYKYLLLRTFAISTGEDPDKISSAELDSTQGKKMPSTDGVDGATDKQKALVEKLIKDVAAYYQISDSEAVGTLKREMKNAKDINKYTKSEASKAIDILNDALKRPAS